MRLYRKKESDRKQIQRLNDEHRRGEIETWMKVWKMEKYVLQGQKAV